MKSIKQLESILLQPQLHLLFKISLLICTIAIAILAFGTLDENVGELSYDKANHIIAFFVLAFLLDYSYPQNIHPQITFFKVKMVILLAYAIFIEVVQYFLPYRTFSVIDIAADLAGILIYLTLKRRILSLSR